MRVLSLHTASAALLAVTLLLLPSPAARAASSNSDAIPDAAALVQLDLHAQQADPRERCFLYTELAHVYTEIAGHQIAAGDMDQATLSLKHAEHYAGLIHTQLARDSKRLKNAEMLMHQTTHKLGEYLHLVSSDDKAVVQSTLKQLDKVNEELLAQVFAH